MKINVQKIMFTLFGLFVLAFVGVTLFNYFYEPYQTETVSMVTVNDTIDANALAVRNEKVVTSDNSGIKSYCVQNGDKVAKGADIIDYYPDSESASRFSQMNTLKTKIEQLTAISTQNSNYAADLDLISSNASQTMLEMLNDVDENDFSAVQDSRNEFLYALCKSGVTTGKITDMDLKIDELKSQLEALENSSAKPGAVIASDYSGYFVNTVDGYENSVDYANITEMSVSGFSAVKQQTVDNNAVGKVVCDTSWYLLAVIGEDDAHALSEGDIVKIDLPLSSVDTISASVTALNPDGSGKVLVVLNCTNMNSELSLIRKQKVQIIIGTYTGLRVNSKAIRVKDGKKGVYVSLGGLVKFREVEIEYASKEYVIVNSESNDGQLKIYDDVIVKGKNSDG